MAPQVGPGLGRALAQEQEGQTNRYCGITAALLRMRERERREQESRDGQRRKTKTFLVHVVPNSLFLHCDPYKIYRKGSLLFRRNTYPQRPM